MVEKFSEKKEYVKLTPEQEKVFDELNEIIEEFEKEPDSDLHKEKKENIITFIHDMEGLNLSPQSFVLGRRLLGEKMVKTEDKFDTENDDITAFIRSLKE